VNFAQLKTNLKVKILPVYLLYGTDVFLLYKSVDLIAEALNSAAGRAVETTKFDDDIPPGAVVTALRTPSFFSVKRIVVYKIAEKMPVGEINMYIKSPEPDSVLVMMGFADKNVYGIKGAAEVNCNPMDAGLLMRLIANQILPKRITDGGARFLAEVSGGNYSMINNELNKIVNYFADEDLIDIPHIREFADKTADYQIYELGGAILAGKANDAEKMLRRLLESDIAEYAVFGGVVSCLRRAFYATAAKADQNAVAKVLGCSPYAVVYSRRDYASKSKEAAMKYGQALNLEYKIKSGQISIANALFSLICH
jgi:DNA polymerase-3 subunit delta